MIGNTYPFAVVPLYLEMIFPMTGDTGNLDNLVGFLASGSNGVIAGKFRVFQLDDIIWSEKAWNMNMQKS